MSDPVAVLLLDDGELDDVQHVLDDLRIAYGRVRGGAIAEDTPPPTNVLITTPRRLTAVRGPVEGEDPPVRIVVAGEDSTTLRAQLREHGFDFIVRRPVHPEALRLLLLHCLYTGEERRSQPRVPVGYEISFRTGLLPRRATLADLSRGGCRLLSRYPLDAGKHIKVQIPGADERHAMTSIRGHVVRMSFEARLGAEGLYSAAVQFDRVSKAGAAAIERALDRQSQGPATLAAEPGATRTDPTSSRGRATADARDGLQRVDLLVDVRMDEDDAKPESTDETPEVTSADEKRQTPRHAYERRVAAFGSRAMRVLVGRDLSRGGMRVERLSEVEIGDRLHLAIYGTAGAEPFLVWATVARDDDSDGLGLVFDALDPSVGDQLENLLVSLPAVESLHDDEAHAMGTVVSEILED